MKRLNMVVRLVDFVRSILESVKVVAEAIRRLPDCIISVSEVFSDVKRGEEIWRRLPEGVVVSEIFRRLPTGEDVARASCVCRSWNALLSSPEFRHLWFVSPCTDIEPWMSSSSSNSSCELPELRWTAVTHRHCAQARQLDIVVSDSDREISIRLWETIELASSHGLICRYWNEKSRILVGNHRTRKWKLLPPFPGNNVKWLSTRADEAYSVRFLRHDLLQQTYILFFLEIYVESHQVFAHLYDSRSSSWQPISRHPMPRHRFRSGICDGSVVVVGYNHLHSIEELRAQGVRVEEVGILAYDFCDNSWDEITTTLKQQQQEEEEHSSSASLRSAAAENGICFRYRLDEMRGYRMNSVFLCANAKDDYCRLVVANGSLGVMCLWQLDKESCTVFRLVSTVQLRPQRPWADMEDPISRREYSRSVRDDGMGMLTWIIRSDATVFMAMVTYGRWSWLVVYDVRRSSLLTAHAYGDTSSLECGISCVCRWALFEYDVQWHDHEEDAAKFQFQWPHEEALRRPPLLPLQGHRLLRPNHHRPCAAAALGRLGCRHRLHLVCVPDIWSTP